MGFICCDVEWDNLFYFLATDRALAIRGHDDLGTAEASTHMLAWLSESVLVKGQANNTLALPITSICPVRVESICFFERKDTAIGQHFPLNKTDLGR